MLVASCRSAPAPSRVVVVSICFIACGRDGFWCRDEAMLLWCAMVADTLHAIADAPQPENQWARQGWALALAATCEQLATHQGEEVTLQLADFLETTERRQRVRVVALQRRAQVSDDELGEIGDVAKPPALVLCTRDPEGACGRVQRAADAFVWLLEEERSPLPAELALLFASAPETI